jgi:hypothetical protein
MATVEERIMPLAPGDRMTRPEFLSLWDAHPEIKRAELIGGIVYMPSPLSREHGVMETRVTTWLGTFVAFTPGAEAGNNTTTLMLDDSPQPDIFLRILPELGGRSGTEGKYLSGGPELIAEICLSWAAYDLHQKRALYEEVGVPEYVAVLLHEQEVRWHRRGAAGFERLAPGADGVYHSEVFPGLWLDPQALLTGDMARVLTVLQQGLATPEHAALVARLTAARSS